MKKLLAIYILFITATFSQVENIPYDWAGQYGAVSNSGQIMWNQDWQVGPLLFDGTFSNYPLRYGSSYFKNFKLKEIGNSYNSIHTFPDTSNVWSIADYYRGDYSYDQLGLIFSFEEQNRIIVLDGFKRTYKGPYGQYIKNDDSPNPLQQSYRIDYLSKSDKNIIDLSVGYFYTDSRLNLTDPADFRHEEKTLAVGAGYQHNFDIWGYKTHFAASQQNYFMRFDSTQYYRAEFDTTEANINRLHLNQYMERMVGSNSSIRAGLELDLQSIKRKLPDNAKVDRVWSTVYGEYGLHSTNLRVGATISENEVYPTAKLSNILRLAESGRVKSEIIYFAKPGHLYLISENMEKWLTASMLGDFTLMNIPLTMQIYYANSDADLVYRYNDEIDNIDLSKDLLTTSVGTFLPLIRDWKLELFYRHTFSENMYSDGIGDRIKIGVNIREKIYKNRINLNMKLWTDGYLNRSEKIGFDGIHFGPYITNNSNFVLPDYWVLNLDISVNVSKMTFGWKVNNILKTLEGLTEQALPNLGEEYLLINNNYNFPPMNRFVSFNIIWEFDN